MLPVSEGSVDRSSPTKLVIAIVQIDDVQDLMHSLVERGLGATRIDAAGGFLRKENAVVLIATTDAGLPTALAVLRETSRTRNATWFPTIDDGTIGLYTEPIEVEVGGAVVFVIPIERVEYLGGVIGAVGAAVAGQSGGGQ
jgi:uncharacterized protein YaaQ